MCLIIGSKDRVSYLSFKFQDTFGNFRGNLKLTEPDPILSYYVISKTIEVLSITCAQYQAIFNRWRHQTDPPRSLTAMNIHNLGHILCGAFPTDIADISLDDFE